ncbi:MAG: hypothetical protein VYE73_10455 [Acidobacteriota bacterium]|nr:hypothetical protein [Acidobacteriota bacterium]
MQTPRAISGWILAAAIAGLVAGAAPAAAKQCSDVEILRSPGRATVGHVLRVQNSAENCGSASQEGFLLTWGEVVSIGEGTAEGDLSVMVLRLDDPNLGEVVLAPAAALEAMGFLAEVGDRVRARVFVDERTKRAFAQKVLNRDRGLMIRLRTLKGLPLCDARGHWQGAHHRDLRDRVSDRRPRKPVRRHLDRPRPRPQSR